MFIHLLVPLVLTSFSIAASAAAIPVDVDQMVPVTTQNAVLHKDVALYQEGGVDRVVSDSRTKAALDACQSNVTCIGYGRPAVINKTQAADGRLAAQGRSSILQPVAVLLLIIGVIVFFLARKSASTK